MSCGNDTALVEPELIGGLNPIFLGQQIIFGLIGIFTNSYSLYHILMKFNLSKILYKLLMAASIINIVQFVANILAAIWLLLFTENEIVCIILTFTFIFPKLVLQFYVLFSNVFPWHQVLSGLCHLHNNHICTRFDLHLLLHEI